MKNIFIILFSAFFIFFLVGCSGKPSAHPKHPNYNIIKPTVKYAPSKKNLAKMVKQLQGSPYVWAEEGPNYFDCSGFTYYMYGSMGIELPRRAQEQARRGRRVSPSALEYGDLIFFATNKRHRRRITHVGMYLGNGWFTHASTVKNEIVYSNLFKSSYYKNRLRACRRYLPQNKVHQSNNLIPVWEKKYRPMSTQSTAHKAIVINNSPQPLHAKTYIQVGSFVGVADKEVLMRIASYGLSHKIIRYQTPQGSIAKVLIGPYASKIQARQSLDAIRRDIQPDAFIAEIR